MSISKSTGLGQWELEGSWNSDDKTTKKASLQNRRKSTPAGTCSQFSLFDSVSFRPYEDIIVWVFFNFIMTASHNALRDECDNLTSPPASPQRPPSRLLSPPTSNGSSSSAKSTTTTMNGQATGTVRRWRHPKFYQTIVGDRRYHMVPNTKSPGVLAKNERRSSVKDAVADLLLREVGTLPGLDLE